MTDSSYDEDGAAQVLKTDVLGRVKTSKAQRERLLDEFERSGLSGTKFAAVAGVNYQTFASWVQKRRRATGAYAKVEPSNEPVPVKHRKVESLNPALQWLEAVVVEDKQECGITDSSLKLLLPGGACVDINQAVQIQALIRSDGKRQAPMESLPREAFLEFILRKQSVGTACYGLLLFGLPFLLILTSTNFKIASCAVFKDFPASSSPLQEHCFWLLAEPIIVCKSESHAARIKCACCSSVKGPKEYSIILSATSTNEFRNSTNSSAHFSITSLFSKRDLPLQVVNAKKNVMLSSDNGFGHSDVAATLIADVQIDSRLPSNSMLNKL